MNFKFSAALFAVFLLLNFFCQSALANEVDAEQTSEVAAGEKAESDTEGSNALMNLLFPKVVDPNMPPLQPNAVLFVFTLILFVSFVFLMRSTTWQPLINGLNAREARVAQAERDAQSARHEAQRLQQETEAKLAEVQEQVKELIAQARAKAEVEKQSIVDQAQAEAERVKQEALEAISSARDNALQEMSGQIDEQVAFATEHVVGRRLN